MVDPNKAQIPQEKLAIFTQCVMPTTLFSLLLTKSNDYGQTQLTAADEFEHQRFSLATFVGVNFPLLRAFFGEGKRCRWIEPYDEAGGIHARLLGLKVAGETEIRFQEHFGKTAHDRRQEPLGKARACAKVGRFELAATF